MGLYKIVETTLKSCREFCTEVFFGREKFFSANVIVLHAALILISIAFVYFLSYTTSFRYTILDGDSSIFQSVGKCWTQGLIPYRDIFEHKGALLFLVDALGYAIYPRSGIMVPQIIFMYVSLLLLWRVTEILKFGVARLLVFALTILYYAAHYHAGNYATEYNMPFLMAATYIFLRDLNSPRVPILHGFIYGFGFGASVLLRATNAMPLCCFAFLSAVFLLRAGELKNLWQNFLSFCAGFAIIVLPFVIYFAAHGALYDAFYGTILFNMKYIGVPAPEGSFFYKVVYLTIHLLPLLLMTAASLGEMIQGRVNKFIVSGFFVGVMMIALHTKMRLYVHYYMTVVPLIPLFVAVCSEFVANSRPLFDKIKLRVKKIWKVEKFSFERLAYKFFVTITALYFGGCAGFYLSSADFNWAFRPSVVARADDIAERELREVTALKKIIPENERDSFVCWGDHNTTPHWLIYADMQPRERLFMNNGNLINVDRAMWTEWFGNVTSKPPLWILYGVTCEKNPDGEFKALDSDAELERLLAEKYSFKGETFIFPQIMKLYRLKE